MNLFVDHSRNKIASVRVDYFDVIPCRNPRRDFLNAFSVNQNVDITDRAFVDESRVAYQYFAQCVLLVFGKPIGRHY